jgi:hypothetical protein
MLQAVGTTDAVREIIRVYVRFGEYMRIDCQRALEELGDRSVAGLIEAERHPAPKIAAWATRRLALRGKNTPQDAVRTKDQVALADILIALGRKRDPESTRLLISFAGADEARVRTAARQAIAIMGEVGAWQLRDAYLSTTGKQPPREWTWKRTARELFTEFDRLRLEQLYVLFQKGKAAQDQQDWEAMRAAFDEILALSPEFESGSEMAPGYIAYATAVAESQPQQASVAYSRAERLAAREQLRNQAKSARLLLEAAKLRKEGIIDRSLIQQAADLNPENRERAEQLLQPTATEKEQDSRSHYLVGLLIAGVALAGAIWIALSGWSKRKHVPVNEPSSAPDSRLNVPAAQKTNPKTNPKTNEKTDEKTDVSATDSPP